jgi:NADH:ubiquinone oxidoreductase subunit
MLVLGLSWQNAVSHRLHSQNSKNDIKQQEWYTDVKNKQKKNKNKNKPLGRGGRKIIVRRKYTYLSTYLPT